MDVVFRLTLFLHLGALLVAAASNIAIPMLGQRMKALAPEARTIMGSMARNLSNNARLSLLVLVVTGLALVAMRYDAALWANPWFALKMACVAAIIVLVVGGLLPAARNVPPRVFGMLTRIALVGAVFSAVMAFG
jgi:uncharacterized membrane protein